MERKTKTPFKLIFDVRFSFGIKGISHKYKHWADTFHVGESSAGWRKPVKTHQTLTIRYVKKSGCTINQRNNTMLQYGRPYKDLNVLFSIANAYTRCELHVSFLRSTSMHAFMKKKTNPSKHACKPDQHT